MKSTIQYIGFLFLMCCANIALALDKPEETSTQIEQKADHVLEQKVPEYNFTLFKFFSIKPETKKAEPNPTTKPLDSKNSKPEE